MNLLDRYIFKSVLGSCLAAVALFAFVLVLGNFIRDLLSHVLAGQLPALTLLKLIWFWVPAMAIYALPMGILTGVLLTMGRLSADSEITAMRAAGISLARIARPVIILGALGAAAAVYMNFESMPRARVNYERDLATALGNNPLGLIVPRTFIRSFNGYVLYVGDRRGNELDDFWLWELDSRRRAERLIRARRGQLDYEPASNTLILTLDHAQVTSFDAKNPESFSTPPLVGTFGRADRIRLPLDEFFHQDTFHQKMKWFTYGQLRAERDRLRSQKVPAGQAAAHAQALMQVNMTLQDKLQNALAVFCFALIGIPLGIKVSRRETSANLGIAVLFALLYYLLAVIIDGLGRYPALRPDLLMWAPNLLMVGCALWLFRRVVRS